MALLEVKNLTVTFETLRGNLEAVQNLSFSVEKGESLGIVGESGSGKSVTSLAVLDLLASNGYVSSGEILFEGRNLLRLSEKQKQKIRGADISMIFQDPMHSLNPCYTVGDQILETLKIHQGSHSGLKDKARELLFQVGIPSPDERMKAFPHQLSGGMSQRVMIAMAIACSPKLLIADEPTTALDVTIQSQILELLSNLQKKNKMAMILISHDLGVISENTENVMVMYAGQAVEKGKTKDVIMHPSHPYTEGLLSCLPSRQFDTNAEHLPTIPGVVPDLTMRPLGCQLHERCKYVQNKCKQEMPSDGLNHHGASSGAVNKMVKCFYPLNRE